MSILLMEGFDHMAISDTTMKGWSDMFDSVALGRFGFGSAMSKTDGEVAKALSATSNATIMFGLGFRPMDLTGTDLRILTLRDGATEQVTVSFNGTQDRIDFYRGGLGGTLLGSTAAQSFSAGTWYHLEGKILLDQSVGTVLLNLNGAEVLSLTAQDTMESSNAQVTHVVLGEPATGLRNLYVDDLVILDSSGTENNDLLGDCRITTLFPNADGANSDFTPSSGTDHYALVDETTPNNTDDVSSSVVGQKDTYAFSDMPTNALVKAIQVNICASKDDAGPRSIAPVIRQGSTDYDGDSVALGASQAYVSQVYQLNPATSAAFTPAEINANEFGVKVSA